MGKSKQALIKTAPDLQLCPEGTEVILVFNSGEDFTGIFQGFIDDQIKLKSLTSDTLIGLPYNQLDFYLQRIK